MTAWTTLINALFLPGKPILGSTGVALRDNLQATTEGATGAPRIIGNAISRPGNGLPVLTIAAADTYTLADGSSPTPGTLNTTSTTEVAAYTWTMTNFTGTVRVKATHSISGGTSTLLLYKNGSLVTSFTTTTSAGRSVDVTFVANDVIEWRHKTAGAGTSTVTPPTANGDNSWRQFPPLIKATEYTG